MITQYRKALPTFLILALFIAGLSWALPVQALEEIEAGFTAAPTSGTPPLSVQFTDASTGDPTGWAWYFGDEDFASDWIHL